MVKSKRPYEEFVFHVRKPSLSYSFRIQHDRTIREVEPFEQRESVHFVTACIYPARFRGREGTATIYPEDALLEPTRLRKEDVHRKWIGHVHATKSAFETTLWLPPPACWRLGQAMASGLVRSMLANGPAEARGMCRVIGASFYGQEFDAVAYVG